MWENSEISNGFVCCHLLTVSQSVLVTNVFAAEGLSNVSTCYVKCNKLFSHISKHKPVWLGLAEMNDWLERVGTN